MAERQKICPVIDRLANNSSSSSSEEEPRTMGDESFGEWTETMAGLNERGGRMVGEQVSRIPVLRSRWVYENWMERLDGTNTGDDLLARTGVPRIRSSRIPIPVPFRGYRPSRIPVATGQARNQSPCQCCFQRNSAVPRTACQPSRIPIPISGRNLRIDANGCICLCHNH
jgi:hypothetical protein